MHAGGSVPHPPSHSMTPHPSQQSGSITLVPAPQTPSSNAMITSPILPNGASPSIPGGSGPQAGPSTSLPTPKLPPAPGPPYPPGPSSTAAQGPPATPNAIPNQAAPAQQAGPVGPAAGINGPPSPYGSPPPEGPYPPGPPAQENSGLDLMDVDKVPPELKKEGSDWFAVFNGNPSGTNHIGWLYELSLI